MKKLKIDVELLFLEWDELNKFIRKELIIFNSLKPWLGFNKVYLLEIVGDVLRIETQERAFNKISITKDKYLVEYMLTDNLLWHRK